MCAVDFQQNFNADPTNFKHLNVILKQNDGLNENVSGLTRFP